MSQAWVGVQCPRSTSGIQFLEPSPLVLVAGPKGCPLTFVARRFREVNNFSGLLAANTPNAKNRALHGTWSPSSLPQCVSPCMTTGQTPPRQATTETSAVSVAFRTGNANHGLCTPTAAECHGPGTLMAALRVVHVCNGCRSPAAAMCGGPPTQVVAVCQGPGTLMTAVCEAL